MHSLAISLLHFNLFLLFMFSVFVLQVGCINVGKRIEAWLDHDQVYDFMTGCLDPEKNEAAKPAVIVRKGSNYRTTIKWQPFRSIWWRIGFKLFPNVTLVFHRRKHRGIKGFSPSS